MRVQLPDGKVAEFPDDMKPDDVAAVIRGKYQNPTREMSTITGRPVPTVEEKVAQSAGVAKTAGPILGDIAGTALMPQFSLPLKGASLAARLAPRAANLGLRMLGSGAGSAGGTVAGQVVSGEPIDMGEAGQQAFLGAGGEAGIAAVGGPLKFVGGKVAKPAMEFLSDITVLGSATKNKLRNQLIERTTKRAGDFVNDIAPDVIKKQSGSDLNLMVSEAMDESKAAYKMYESALEKNFKEGKEILFDDTAQFLGEIRNDIAEKLYLSSKSGRVNDLAVLNNVLKEFGLTPKQGFELSKIMQSEVVTPKQAEYLMATVFSGYHKLPPSQQAMREKLKDVMLGDLNKLSAGEGKTVASIKKEADETFKAVKQFQFVKNLFDNATREVAETGEKTIQPKKLYDLIYQNRFKIQRDMPDLWPKLKEEADFYMKIAPEFSKQAQKPGLSRAAGSLAGGWLMGPAGVPVAEGAGLISAYALMSPKGKKIISNIINQTAKAGTKAGIHLGGEEILMKSHD